MSSPYTNAKPNRSSLRESPWLSAAALALTLWLLFPAPTHAPSDPCPLPCPTQGCGGDPDLNRQKNRTAEPTPYERYTFGRFVRLNSKAVNKKRRENWTPEETRSIAEREDGPGVILVGYLFDAKYADPESANCFRHELNWRDFHLWVVRSRRRATKPESIVVEITPPIRQGKTGWDLAKLRQLIPPKAWTRVRVKGYLFFDSEHWDFPQREPPVRATAWEIHPVTEFSICPPQTTCRADSNEGWVRLEEYRPN